MPAPPPPAAVAVVCLLVVSAIPAVLAGDVPSSTNVTAADAAPVVAATSTSTPVSTTAKSNWWWSWRYKTLTHAVKAASALPTMTTLIAAVVAADLPSAWTAPETAWTIFAPTNAAFNNLLDDLGLTADELLANKALLAKVLSYHVLASGAVTSGALALGNQVVGTALTGKSVSITKFPSGRVRITGGTPCNVARVTAANIRAGKSVIHVVDAVLVPN